MRINNFQTSNSRSIRGLKCNFQFRALSEGKIIYEKDYLTTCDYIEKVIGLYQDYAIDLHYFYLEYDHDFFPLPEEELFSQMVKFRNRVVHLYQAVDDKEIYKILQDHLDDFSLFIKAVTRDGGYSKPV